MSPNPRRHAVVTAVAAAAAVSVVTLFFQRLSVGTQSYRDIVVGEITYADAYKHADILLPFLAVGCFFLIWFVLVLLPFNRSPDIPVPCAKTGAENRMLPWGLCFFGAGLLLFRNGGPRYEFVILLALLAVYAAARFVAKPNDQMASMDETEGCHTISSVLTWAVSVWGIFFSIIGLLALVRFIMPTIFVGREGNVSSMPLYAALIGGFGLLLLLRSSASLRCKIAIWSQLLIPLVLLTFFSRVMIQNGVVSDNLLPMHSKIIGLVIAIGGVTLNVWGIIRCKFESDKNQYLLVPSIVAAASFLAYVTPAVKPVDFFHTGEQLLAWQQIFEYGQMPYSGFAWARGWSDAFPGLLAKLFFDGTFATFDHGFNVTGMLIAGVAAFLLCRAVGPLWGLVLSMLGAQSGIFKWWLFLPILLILADPVLLRRPLRWLSAWLVLSVIHCLYQATSGIALTFGTLPVAFWMVYQSWKNNEVKSVWETHRKTFLVSALTLAAFCCAATPLLIGFVSYLHDQGAVNEIANGTVLGRPTRIPEWFRWKTKFLWEMFRVGGWMFGIIILWHYTVRELSEYRRSGNTAASGPALVVGIAAIFSTIAFIPYSMGRIDSAGLSRTGTLSVFIFAVLIPLLIRASKRSNEKPAMFLCSFFLGISLVPFQINLPAIAKSAVAPTEISSDMVWFNGAANGLPMVGETFMQGDQLEMITGFKQVADSVLKPGETFYDLTNFLAYYYFLDKKVSSIYAGYYTVTSEVLQNKVIAALEKSPPPLVLAAPAREYFEPASVRSYRVYRWFMQKGYVPFVFRGMGYLVKSDRCKQLPIPIQTESSMTDDLSRMFAPGPLGLIPVAWGRSLDELARRFDKVKVATSISTMSGSVNKIIANRVNCNIEGGINGGFADFLLLRINAKSRPEPLLVKLHWASPERSDNELEFYAVPEAPLLVPIGSHPAWLRTARVDQLNIEITGAPATIEQVEFLHLKR